MRKELNDHIFQIHLESFLTASVQNKIHKDEEKYARECQRSSETVRRLLSNKNGSFQNRRIGHTDSALTGPATASFLRKQSIWSSFYDTKFTVIQRGGAENQTLVSPAQMCSSHLLYTKKLFNENFNS